MGVTGAGPAVKPRHCSTAMTQASHPVRQRVVYRQFSVKIFYTCCLFDASRAMGILVNPLLII